MFFHAHFGEQAKGYTGRLYTRDFGTVPNCSQTPHPPPPVVTENTVVLYNTAYNTAYSKLSHLIPITMCGAQTLLLLELN